MGLGDNMNKNMWRREVKSFSSCWSKDVAETDNFGFQKDNYKYLSKVENISERGELEK